MQCVAAHARTSSLRLAIIAAVWPASSHACAPRTSNLPSPTNTALVLLISKVPLRRNVRGDRVRVGRFSIAQLQDCHGGAAMDAPHRDVAMDRRPHDQRQRAIVERID